MEVTTVSPSPASPTQGADLCETDVTSMAIHSVTLLIYHCGLVGNGAVPSLFSTSRCNNFLTDLTAAHLLFLLFIVPSTLRSLVNVFCSTLVLPMYLSLLLQLSLSSCQTELFWLVFISIKRYREPISFKLWCHFQYHQYQPQLRVMIRPLHWAFLYVFIRVVLIVYFQCLFLGKCQMVHMSLYILTHLLFAAPLVTSTAIIYIMAHFYNQQKEPTMLKHIIFFSALFSFPISLSNFMRHLSYTEVSSQMLLLTGIQSSIKPFIYFIYCLRTPQG
ncbi:PREDICTED: uncharacterized protein LOC107604390 [Ficedula albicollis]|uniref:uncharacterized protein LOC107604390 n=1 Tax=Ficedula albicollis TaxID=59894 RepID=UPI0007AD808C|nr:PREDICTED: uncharacterized protein LOC107604390 [Ficedula albicollis]